MIEVPVLCDSAEHPRRRVLTGHFPLVPRSISPDRQLMLEALSDVLGTTVSDARPNLDRFTFECTRCRNRLRLADPAAIATVRHTLSETGVSEVTLGGLRYILKPS